MSSQWGRVQPGRAVIDCDLHAVVPSVETLFPWLADRWKVHQSVRLQGTERYSLSQGADQRAARRQPPGGGPAG
jgi:hypothetical protein